MPAKKIVVKVSINCEKCKKDVFKAVTKLTGIDQVSLDGEKGLLTIIGTVDPVDVVERIKVKTKKGTTSLESVGPVVAAKPPEPPKPASQKPDPVKERDTPASLPKQYWCNNCERYGYAYGQKHCYNNCELVGFVYGPLPDGGSGRDCTIL